MKNSKTSDMQRELIQSVLLEQEKDRNTIIEEF